MNKLYNKLYKACVIASFLFFITIAKDFTRHIKGRSSYISIAINTQYFDYGYRSVSSKKEESRQKKGI
jgi:hypothetical protein